MGQGRRILISRDGKRIKVRDFGRGIPLGKVVECVSVINTGAKYNDDVFQFSVGLNGVGTKAVNALSSHFRVVAVRGGKAAEAVFSKGKLLKERQIKKTEEADGTYIEFEPDEEIFGEYEFDDGFIEKRIKNYTYLNAGLELDYNGVKYISKNGLLDRCMIRFITAVKKSNSHSHTLSTTVKLFIRLLTDNTHLTAGRMKVRSKRDSSRD